MNDLTRYKRIGIIRAANNTDPAAQVVVSDFADERGKTYHLTLSKGHIQSSFPYNAQLRVHTAL
jgi:hypothetical protein